MELPVPALLGVTNVDGRVALVLEDVSAMGC